jgi:hypothetical protein
MTMASSDNPQATPGKATVAGSGKRKWPVTAVGLLLLFEAVLLLCIFPVLVFWIFLKLPAEQLSLLFPATGGIAPLNLTFSGMRGFLLTIHFATVDVVIPADVTSSAIFGFFSPILIVTGVAFLNRWRRAWLLAVFLQGLFLSLALIFYFNLRHPYVYLVMLYCSYLVFYLNHHEVRIAFPDLRPEARKGLHESAPSGIRDS